MELLLDSEESGGASAMNTRIDVYLLPDYYGNTAHAGKSHIGVPRRKLGTINNSDDLESAVRKFASEPGAYYAELRAGRDVLDSGVFPLQPRAQNIALDLSPASEPPQDAQVLLLQQISQRLERLESGNTPARAPNKVRVRRSQSEFATPNADASLNQEIIKRELDHLERERARDREESSLKLKIAELELKQSHPQQDNLSPDFSNLVSKIVIAKMQDGDQDLANIVIDRFFGREDESETKRGGLMDIIGKALENPEGAQQLVGLAVQTLGMVSNTLMPQAAPVPQAPPQQRAPQRQAPPREVPTPGPEATAQAAPQPPTFESESDTVITNLLLDMDKNRGVKSSARDIVSLMKDFPAETQMLATLLEQPSETILQVLAGRIPSCASIVGKPESAAWLDRLKVEIKTRQQKAANVAPVVPDASETVAQAKTA